MLASAILGALTIGSSPGAPPPSPSADGLTAVRAVLVRSPGASAARDDVLVRRLVALGAEAAPALLALATGDGLEAFLVDDAPEAWMCPPERVATLALAALAELPAVPVRALLRAETRARAERGLRMVALDVLGRQGSAEGLELYLELAQECGDELEHHAVRAVARDALLAMLRADSACAGALEKALPAAPRAVQLVACEALARCNRPASVGLLTKLFGRDVELDLAALEGLTQLGERYPWRVGEDVLVRLRKSLAREEPRLRAAVARALGRLADGQSFRALVELCAEPDPALARAAQWSMRALSGETRLAQADEWQRWLEAESTWWRDRGLEWLAALAPGDTTRLSAALRELALHPLGRERVVDTLAENLDQYDAAAQAVACRALARLGSRRAVPALIELLFQPADEQRTAAWQALRTLTGEDLPAEPQLWEAYALD